MTIADVAQAAGVSASTVSRALNNHSAIPESTRHQIQQIASEMGYRPDVRARNFRLQRSETIATLFPYQEGIGQHPISDPFYLEIMGAITDELDQHGYDSIIARVHAQSDDWCERYVVDKRVDGILLIDRAVDDISIHTLQALGANFVVWGAELPDQTYVSVGCDGQAGAQDAVRHLLSIGRKCIGFIGGFRGMVETAMRHQGYERALIESGLGYNDSLVVYTDFTPEGASHAVQTLLERAPDLDGIFACSDFMAVGVMEVLRQMGREVGYDISVVGYDDIPLAAHVSPKLTTIRQPIQQGGRLMVQSLFEMMEGHPVQSTILPHQLIVRDSSTKKKI